MLETLTVQELLEINDRLNRLEEALRVVTRQRDIWMKIAAQQQLKLNALRDRDTRREIRGH